VLEASIPTWGKKPRRLAYRCVLAKLAAAVTALTALKQEGGVGGAIALVAACSGIDRQTLRNFRDGLNRGRGDARERYAHARALFEFEGLSRAQILAVVKAVFVPTPS